MSCKRFLTVVIPFQENGEWRAPVENELHHSVLECLQCWQCAGQEITISHSLFVFPDEIYSYMPLYQSKFHDLFSSSFSFLADIFAIIWFRPNLSKSHRFNLSTPPICPSVCPVVFFHIRQKSICRIYVQKYFCPIYPICPIYLYVTGSTVLCPPFLDMLNQNWLVVWTPLKNISQLGWLFPIYGKIKNVPNHQPAINTINFTHIYHSIHGYHHGITIPPWVGR